MYYGKNDDFSLTHANFLKNMADEAIGADSFDPALYEKYNVKRGLRNANGTGVLVGLTSIGDVRGYIMEEGETVPIDGRLLYRGIDIDKFVNGYVENKRFGFEECAYLLLTGKLPTSTELDEFKACLDESRKLPEGFAEDMIMKAPSPDIMNKLARSVLATYSYDTNPDDISYSNVLRQCIRLIAQFPTMVAYGFQARNHYYMDRSLYIHNPKSGLSTAENFLQMIRPNSEYTELEAETLDLNLVIHAEHGGGNNSTFTDHVVTSTGTDTYSAIAASVGSLKGPKHGGANIRVMEMMDEIKANVSDWENEAEVKDYLVKILKGEGYDHTGLVYGMGHAIYTKSDPRARLLKKKAAELVVELGGEWEKEFYLYDLIERVSPTIIPEVRGINKTICANVDFYSGFVYSMLGIPRELYTPIFAISRIAGWSAHRLEELAIGRRIIRPAYKNVGEKQEYIDLSERG